MYRLDKIDLLSNLWYCKTFESYIGSRSQEYMNEIIKFAIGDERCLVISSPHIGSTTQWKEGMGDDAYYLLSFLYQPCRSNVI